MPDSQNPPILRFAQVVSTNAVAMELALQGAVHGTMVLASQQEQGRGRGAKKFSSPPGGLYMSLILRPNLAPEHLPFIPLAAGVVCAQAIEELTGLAIALKWPNDLYLRGGKLGGILAETGPYSLATHGIPFVVLGMGINVNSTASSFASELRNIVTSLYDVRQEQYDSDVLRAAIHSRLDALLVDLKGNLASVLHAWQRRDYLLDRDVTWREADGRTMRGRGAGIRGDGCYQLQTPDGVVHAILAGEVTLGPVGEEQK